MKKNFYRIILALTAIFISLSFTSCGPTVQDYSEAMSGTWARSVEENDGDGYFIQGTLLIAFDPIPEGEDTGNVRVELDGHIDGSSNQTMSANTVISVKGAYTIDPEQEEYPLTLYWDVNSLQVKVTDVKIEDIQTDMEMMFGEVAGAALGIGVNGKQAIAKALKKQIKSNCRNILLERNDDPGAYAVEVDNDRLTISGDGFHTTFEYCLKQM